MISGRMERIVRIVGSETFTREELALQWARLLAIAVTLIVLAVATCASAQEPCEDGWRKVVEPGSGIVLHQKCAEEGRIERYRTPVLSDARMQATRLATNAAPASRSDVVEQPNREGPRQRAAARCIRAGDKPLYDVEFLFDRSNEKSACFGFAHMAIMYEVVRQDPTSPTGFRVTWITRAPNDPRPVPSGEPVFVWGVGPLVQNSVREKAGAWALNPGYEWIRPAHIMAWAIDGGDFVMWAATRRYDSPAADCVVPLHFKLTPEERALGATTYEIRDLRYYRTFGNFGEGKASLEEDGREDIGRAWLRVDPAMVRTGVITGSVTLPCWHPYDLKILLHRPDGQTVTITKTITVEERD